MENNHFDDLHYSLPDYITGELNDDNIKEQIEAKLLTDFSFREEYDSLKATMNFMTETELEAPSEVYFANLQANILSKTHKEEVPEKESIFAKLLGYWKVAVPALTVCIVVFIYASNTNTQLPLTQEVKVQLPSTNEGNKIQDANNKDEIISLENAAFIEDVFSDETKAPRFKKSSWISSNENISAEDNTVFAEEIEGSIIFGREDDSRAQDEYNHLSTDDQREILQSLKEKQL